MSGKEHFDDIEALIRNNEEEIAEEFGIFHTMTERDFFTHRLLKKALEEKQKRKVKKDQEGDDHE